MTLARDFGFKVPYNGIIKNEMDYHYIIKRYDRYSDTKIDHTEILTLMDKVSTENIILICKNYLKQHKSILMK
uniref:hypothetical protein n=1 Tax=Aliarcobacter cryaerophilus TaxID=28198 RepID=UPI00155DA631